jgi:dTDP-4-dehydrorhamnose reductase
MTRLLLLGVNGQVGHELARTLAPLGELVVPDRSSYDFARPASLAVAVADAKPDIVVNAAAYTAVDRAESEASNATAVNAEAPASLARAAQSCGALLVHYSTDYVFDGSKAAPYDEDDTPAPLGVYGRTKLEGENAIRASGADHLIFRTSWVYSARGQNFLLTMLRLAAEREQLRVVADQIGAPTWARTIAAATASALTYDLARRRRGEFESGVFHLTASGATSWHGFATAIIAGARARGATLACREVIPISTAEYPTPARRPGNSRLAGERFRLRYGVRVPAWDEALNTCLDEVLGPRRT